VLQNVRASTLSFPDTREVGYGSPVYQWLWNTQTIKYRKQALALSCYSLRALWMITIS